jgi:hypothetical protein
LKVEGNPITSLYSKPPEPSRKRPGLQGNGAVGQSLLFKEGIVVQKTNGYPVRESLEIPLQKPPGRNIGIV